MTVPIVPISELCQMDRQHARPDDPTVSRLPFVGVENVRTGSGVIDLESNTRVGSNKSTTFRFDARHVLYGKLRPYLNKVATPEFSGKCSTELIPLLPHEGIDRDFLAHLLRQKDTVDFVMASVTGSRMPRTDMKVLLSMRVPLPPLDKQRRVAAILNRVAEIEQLRSEAAERLQEFVHALFVKVFGDSAEGENGWGHASLGDVCEVQGGLQVTKKRQDHPLIAPYLRVANVLRDELQLEEIKRIRLTERELERVRLRRGDLLIVEGHGNAKEIGRAAMWNGAIDDCVHQNHLIRARPDRSSVLPEFVCAYLNSSSGRQHLLRRGKTTSGLNTITTSDVRSCELVVPPMHLQQRYRDIASKVRASSSKAASAHDTASELSGSLMEQLIRQ